MAHKAKTNKSLVRRVKVTGSGKVMRMMPGAGHLKSRKSSKQLRSFRKERPVPNCLAKQVKKMLGM